MAMLGERILPNSVNQRRRQLRSRINNLRQPIRSRRENLSPFNVVGAVENTVSDVTDRIVARTAVLERITDRRSSETQNQGGDAVDKEQQNSNSSKETVM